MTTDEVDHWIYHKLKENDGFRKRSEGSVYMGASKKGLYVRLVSKLSHIVLSTVLFFCINEYMNNCDSYVGYLPLFSSGCRIEEGVLNFSFHIFCQPYYVYLFLFSERMQSQVITLQPTM